jgi:hypothetical protein
LTLLGDEYNRLSLPETLSTKTFIFSRILALPPFFRITYPWFPSLNNHVKPIETQSRNHGIIET